MNILSKFKNGIEKSSNYLSSNFQKILLGNKINNETLEELESILISADLGYEATKKLINILKKKKFESQADIEAIQIILAKEIEKILLNYEKKIILEGISNPKVFLFVGVNGSGKTTTIGKLAKDLSSKNKILIAACDTFRAGATEQIKHWADKSNLKLYEGKKGQDPASVAYEACEKAKAIKSDILLIDTAGRLTNNEDLMNQLNKIKKVISKSLSKDLDYIFLVLDGSTGGNIIKQFETFNNLIGINGIIITKLDGTAKGGALVALALKHNISIYFIGVGEKVDDLLKFKAKEFSLSLFNLIK